MPAHIPPGKEDLYRRQAESDAELDRLDKASDAAEKSRNDLAKALGWDDPLVDEADEEMVRLLDERSRAFAVNQRIYDERMTGLSSWIDSDPTAPVCPVCKGGGCKTCRGWGREHREPIPAWSDEAKAWINPATGREVDLLADEPQVARHEAEQRMKRAAPPNLADLRYGRWYDTNPITTTGSTGAAMASIEEVRAGIMASVEKQNEALGAVQHAHATLEEAVGTLLRAVEGSGQADASDATGLLAQAVNSLDEVRQQVPAAISASEQVGNRL